MVIKTPLRLTCAILSKIAAVLLSFISLARAQGPLVSGLDHIPVVVTDLDKAQADYRAMGFAIKPGTVHATAFGMRTSNSRTARRSN